jgi:hypothetical protein
MSAGAPSVLIARRARASSRAPTQTRPLWRVVSAAPGSRIAALDVLTFMCCERLAGQKRCIGDGAGQTKLAKTGLNTTKNESAVTRRVAPRLPCPFTAPARAANLCVPDFEVRDESS